MMKVLCGTVMHCTANPCILSMERDLSLHTTMLQVDTVADAYIVAAGILAQDKEGFCAISQRPSDPANGAGTFFCLFADVLTAGDLVLGHSCGRVWAPK